MTLKILVDADACPVVSIVEEVGRKYGILVTLVCDTAHILRSDYSEIIVVDQGADSADFALVSQTLAGDLVVTQDYGVAAMVLGKGAKAIHQSGREYTNENIDGLLMERHMSKKARLSKKRHHGKGPAKRTEQDNEKFKKELIRILNVNQ